MKLSERTVGITFALGMIELLWAFVVIGMAVVLCFTKSMMLLKWMSSLAVFMAFMHLGLFHAGRKSHFNEDDEIEL